MSNLINSYMNNINKGVNSKPVTTTVFSSPIPDTNELVKPNDGKGHLIENNLLTAPKEMAFDAKYTAKALKKGITGKANDHELGNLNDLGLKLGGIAIATYLMTKKQTPKAKMMEFIGFGSFLASMALWPKIALQWPARLLHGFNFRKQYMDEQGRKKYVTQDPNYMPLDLYKGKKKSENLSGIADKMGISKDTLNRNEIAAEHIRKVSVQNNTMWMLTAGAATPIMTSLICNTLEKPVSKFAEKISNNKVNNLAYDIDKYLTSNNSDEVNSLEKKIIEPKLDKKASTNLSQVLDKHKNKIVSERDIQEISNALTEGLDTQTKKAALLDLSEAIKPNQTIVNNDSATKIVDTISKNIDKHYGKGTSKSVIDSEALVNHINDFMSKNGSEVLSKEKDRELRASISEKIAESLGEKNVSSPKQKVIKNISSKAINSVLETSKGAVLTEGLINEISNAGTTLGKFRAFDEVLSGATHFKVEKAQETIVGNNWGDVTNTLVKELKLTPQELKEAKSSEQLTSEIFIKKLEGIAQNKERYEEFIENISNKMQELDVKLDNPTEGKKGVMEILVNGQEQNCEKTANNLGGTFKNLAKRINGEFIDGARTGSLRQEKIDRIKQARIGNVQNAYMRLLHTADFFRRAEEYKQTKAGFTGNPDMDKEIIEKGKKILVSSHSGDFFLKFQTGNNVSFYKALMWHVFGQKDGEAMSETTLNVLNKKESHEVFKGKSSMAQRVKKWASDVQNLMGTNKYDFLPNHMEGVDKFGSYEKTAVSKFNKIACSPETMLHNVLKQTYNSKKWMKTWGSAGAILLAGTVASQFAFGGKDDNN